MKRKVRRCPRPRGAFLLAVAAFALSVGAAQAETSVFRDVLRPGGVTRSAAERLADGQACGAGSDKAYQNVPAFESCMKTHGWAHDHDQADASDPPGVYYDDMWQSANGPRRSVAEREAAYGACDPRGRRDPGSAAMKSCMLARGWRFAFNKPGAAPAAAAASGSADGETIWKDAARGDRSAELLKADAEACQRQLDAGDVLRPPGPAYQACMRTRGWSYVSSSGPSYWKDPNHEGLMCHDIMGGLGSSCANF
jgi:hypothetical protein